MKNEGLDRAVERLITDRRFRRRFRRNPAKALRGSGLGEAEIEALKGGRAEELIELGMDTSYVLPDAPTGVAPVQMWMLRNARRLVPAALLAGATLAFAAAPAPAMKRRRVDSWLKLTKVNYKLNGDSNGVLTIKLRLTADKDKCVRKRDARVFIKPNRGDFGFLPFGDLVTNRKGRAKLRRTIPPIRGGAVFRAEVEKDKKGKGKKGVTCLDDKSNKKGSAF